MGIGQRLSSLVERACKFVAANRKQWTIEGDDGSPYLTRYYLFRRSWLPEVKPFSLLPSVYLHYFHRGDMDEELHNHPWGYSISLILTGGYHEERRVGNDVHSRIFRPGSLNVVRHTDFHRVDLLDPKNGAWSLFFAGFGGRVPEDDWGFWDRRTRNYLPWKEFVRRREACRAIGKMARRVTVPLFDLPEKPEIHFTRLDLTSLKRR